MKSSINSSFWERVIGNVCGDVLLYQWEQLNDVKNSGCINNFILAADIIRSGEQKGTFTGMVFQDSDLYKWLEAVAFALKLRPCKQLDEQLEKQLQTLAESAVDLICNAQLPDGYVNTYFVINGLDKRFKNLREAHELYCAGHLIEAAVAYYSAAGNEKILRCAKKFADFICDTFGDGEKLHGYPGHEEIELALVKLYELTGTHKYLNTAAYFIDTRGSNDYFQAEMKDPDHFDVWGVHDENINHEYFQNQCRPRDMTAAVGHAVRAVYLYTAMSDIARLRGDSALAEACNRLYENIVNKQMYITGAIGATMRGEAFTADYDLPPDTMYGETCAGIGLMMFCERMYRLTGDAKYIDTLENALYNNVLAGISLDGKAFFYVNALNVHPSASKHNPDYQAVKHTRRPWFGCACCPPNLARTVLNIADYAYDFTEEYVVIKMFIGGSFSDGTRKLTVETGYPYGDTVKITTEGITVLKVRSPAFAPIISVNGEACSPIGGFSILMPKTDSEEIIIKLDIKPELVFTNSNVFYNRGRVAVRRGALIYCAESVDNPPSPDFFSINTADPDFHETSIDSLPLDTVILAVNAEKLCYPDIDNLYHNTPPTREKARLTLLPYHLWGNRGESELNTEIRF
jgi:DUF1680 family protein